MNKTFLLIFAIAVAGFIGLNAWKSRAQEPALQEKAEYEVTKTDAEWKEILSPEAYRVLRHHDTERPGSSNINDVKEDGTFYCAGCDLPLFDSEAKFNSGTGWPSFFQPKTPEALGQEVDNKLFLPRTEVHCSRCGGHLGHVFDDGPKPTGKRFCINGVSLKFKAEEMAK